MKQNKLKYLAFYLAIAAAAQLVIGCHAGGGPVIGYALERGLTLGWEAGGGAGPAHINLGGSYRSEDSKSVKYAAESQGGSEKPETTAEKTPEREAGIEAVHYVVLEPAIPISGTLGLGISTHEGLGFVGGLWFGWAVFGPWTDWEGKIDCDDSWPDDRLFFSGAMGIRYIVGVYEFYLTPKVGVIHCFEIAS